MRKSSILARAFKEAAKDENLNVEFEIWDTCVGDGMNETNKYTTDDVPSQWPNGFFEFETILNVPDFKEFRKDFTHNITQDPLA